MVLDKTQKKVRKLKKPQEFGMVMPRCCATCKHLIHGDGSSYCERDPEEIRFDTGDGIFMFRLCELWKRQD